MKQYIIDVTFTGKQRYFIKAEDEEHAIEGAELCLEEEKINDLEEFEITQSIIIGDSNDK